MCEKVKYNILTHQKQAINGRTQIHPLENFVAQCSCHKMLLPGQDWREHCQWRALMIEDEGIGQNNIEASVEYE